MTWGDSLDMLLRRAGASGTPAEPRSPRRSADCGQPAAIYCGNRDCATHELPPQTTPVEMPLHDRLRRMNLHAR